MSVNKVQLANGETIIDISDSTVTSETLAEGVTAHDASGQKITGKMVPGGGSSVQSDWNQTDETAADFIKNKPFGDELTEKFPETEIVGEDFDGAYIAALSGASFNGTEITLLVTFDGVEYTCNNVGAEFGVTLFGNAGMLEGADTGEPFVIDPNGALVGMPIIVVPDSEQHTVGIKSLSIGKLDAKYVANFASFYISNDFDTDPYLYTDIYLSNKATLADLTAAANTQVIQVFGTLNGTSFITVAPLVVDWLSGYILFNSWKSVNKEFVKVYTAEYTP